MINKKSIMAGIMGLFMFAGSKVYAASTPDVQAVVNGKIEKGENIQILINVKNIDSLYAGDMEFKYDNTVLKVKSIELGDLITKPGVSKFDAIKRISEQNGTARYAFSCTGQIDGFSGSGTFVKINAEVLKKDDKFFINSKPFLKAFDNDYNLKLQLCDKDIKELEYKFIPYGVSAPSAPDSNTGNSGSSGSGSDNNSGGTNPGSNDSSSNTSGSASPGTSNSGNTANGDSGSNVSQNAGGSDNSNANGNNSGNDKTNNDTNKDTAVNTANGSTDNKSNSAANVEKPEAKTEVDKQQTESSASKNKNTGTIAISIVCLAAAGAGAYYFIRKKNRNKDNNSAAL
ncbi:cohesin domain-containing protein [Clostridium swellfunianum]|uniref:cohesin domain-containing protein n=1 Tax=Clostridium swellfunianum TaxID=1367462 RepID=UPI00202F4D4D|nr:cohesin domain-containing protein [Clostridium swellfunianum]MCM0647403.1 cohesin domain-containing protein [Clostridium swellfunianum]